MHVKTVKYMLKDVNDNCAKQKVKVKFIFSFEMFVLHK